jgi:hypothetical protein
MDSTLKVALQLALGQFVLYRQGVDEITYAATLCALQSQPR